jgi:hypothetical protein
MRAMLAGQGDNPLRNSQFAVITVAGPGDDAAAGEVGDRPARPVRVMRSRAAKGSGGKRPATIRSEAGALAARGPEMTLSLSPLRILPPRLAIRIGQAQGVSLVQSLPRSASATPYRE